MKRYTMIALMLMLSITLVACGNQTATEPADVSPEIEAVEPEVETDSAEETQESEADDKASVELPALIDVATAENYYGYSYETVTADFGEAGLDVYIHVQNDQGEDLLKTTYTSYFDQEWLDMYQDADGELVRFVDINGDGIPDIIAQYYGATADQSYYIYVYHEDEGRYIHKDMYDNLINPVVNTQTNQVLSTSYYLGLANYTVYEVQSNWLVEIASLVVESNSSGELLMYETVDERKQVSSVEELNDIWSDFDIQSSMEDTFTVLNAMGAIINPVATENLAVSQVETQYHAATEVADWFRMESLSVDASTSTTYNGVGGYYKVIDFDTMDALTNHMEQYFSQNMIDSLLAEANYVEIDGALYTLDGARGADIYKGEESYLVFAASDDQVLLEVTVEILDDNMEVTGTETYSFYYENQGDSWVFTTFPTVR